MRVQVETEFAQVLRPPDGITEHRFDDHAVCGMSGAMPCPGLRRIEYEASTFGAELAHQDDQVDSA